MILRTGRGCGPLQQIFFAPKRRGFLSLHSKSMISCNNSQIQRNNQRSNLIISVEPISKSKISFSQYFYSSDSSSGSLDTLKFTSVCSETLDSLYEYFEELIESIPHLKNADVTYSDGVLTISFGQKYGTYVINRQTPNLQIWLSSPTSGPKRYDFSGGTWIYKHDNTTLHSLLDKEIREIANQEVEFAEKCLHAKLKI